MPYRFATENKDYSAYASGRVFYGTPGHPAFPVRLISEVFQRCQAIRQASGQSAPAVIYDPCCGGGYHLSTLAYLHWADIRMIIGSDVDGEALKTARRNLGLLTPFGLAQRQQEIEQMLAKFGKASHVAALEEVNRFKTLLAGNQAIHPIKTELFQANCLKKESLVAQIDGRTIDIILADVPYGDLSQWHTDRSDTPPLSRLLDSLSAVVNSQTIIAIMANKAQKCSHPSYNRIDRFQIGKRRIFLLQHISQ